MSGREQGRWAARTVVGERHSSELSLVVEREKGLHQNDIDGLMMPHRFAVSSCEVLALVYILPPLPAVSDLDPSYLTPAAPQHHDRSPDAAL